MNKVFFQLDCFIRIILVGGLIIGPILLGGEIEVNLSLPGILKTQWYGISSFVILIFLSSAIDWVREKIARNSFLKYPSKVDFEKYAKLIQSLKNVMHYQREAYFSISIVGAILAAYYTQTGTFMAIGATVQERFLEKLENRFDNKFKKIKETYEELNLTDNLNENDSNLLLTEIVVQT